MSIQTTEPMSQVLMAIVVDALAFLELSGDDVVDPDAAVQFMESVANSLKSLGPPDRKVFLEFVHVQATAASERGDQRRSQFLRGLPDALGLG